MTSFADLRFCAAYPNVKTTHDVVGNLHTIEVRGERFGGDDLWRKVAHQFVFTATEFKAVAFYDMQRLNYLNPNSGECFVRGDKSLLSPEFQYETIKPDLNKQIIMLRDDEIVSAGIHDHQPSDFKTKVAAKMFEILCTGRIPTIEEMSNV
jgi:hypothetical protein